MYTNGPKGRSFIRMKCSQWGGSSQELVTAFAAARWPTEALTIAKAAQSALQSGDFGTPESIEYTGVVREQSVLGGLVGARAVPFARRMLRRVSGATGYWVGESNPIPLLRPVLEGSVLAVKKIGVIVVTTKEGLLAEGPAAESGLQADLTTGCVGALDVALLDPSNAGSDAMPAAVTNGAPTIDATANAVADLKALIAAFKGDMASAYLATDPATAMGLAMLQTPSGAFAFPECGPRGGNLAGIPLLVSRHSPVDSNGGQIALIDASGIVVAMDSIELAKSENATLAMSDTPTSPAIQVPMFQTDCVAVRATILANWELQRPSGVAIITGANY